MDGERRVVLGRDVQGKAYAGEECTGRDALSTRGGMCCGGTLGRDGLWGGVLEEDALVKGCVEPACTKEARLASSDRWRGCKGSGVRLLRESCQGRVGSRRPCLAYLIRQLHKALHHPPSVCYGCWMDGWIDLTVYGASEMAQETCVVHCCGSPLCCLCPPPSTHILSSPRSINPAPTGPPPAPSWCRPCPSSAPPCCAAHCQTRASWQRQTSRWTQGQRVMVQRRTPCTRRSC